MSRSSTSTTKGSRSRLAPSRRSAVAPSPLTTDVSDADAVKDAIDETVKTLGRLDVAFNNAGIFYNMKYQIEVMLAQGGGSIINTGSVASVVGFQGIPAYTASKHGIVGLTKVAALDYATQG